MFPNPLGGGVAAPFGKVTNVAAPGWWLAGGIAAAQCAAAYQPKGAASMAASCVNLANPGTYDCTGSAPPSWDASYGWLGASGKYLETGYTPSDNYNRAMITRITWNGGNSGYIAGYYVGAWNQALLRRVSATAYAHNNHWQMYGAVTFSADDTIGFSGNKVFFNGILIFTASAPQSGAALPIYLMGYNNNGTPVSIVSIKMSAFAMYNTAVADEQMLAVHNAMKAL